ncbi:Phosphotransferase family protein [Georgfuchsia toluolica]|uniref:Phosphotransferase family protein n=1 Tax=Georgfuchsia toluolica TaxID=424218 RepID=A0A916J5T4_9PROT|nr:phosphotransferase family protein [Georgfuchsia toluolica]CAG4884774.1 Phosphotransferase family protein [Georgfuchsia toluolica]
MSAYDKSHPTHELIEHLRTRFPCEKEIDRILTRKMQRRAGPPFTSVSLETLVKGTEALIRSEIKREFRITEAKWLSGGASKLQMSFTLNWNQPGVGRTSTPMVLRMEPSESIVETSRLREFQIIKAFESHVPVPPIHWIDAEGNFLPYPAIIYGFVEGVTKPSKAISNVAGLCTNLGPELRPILGPQFVDHLARIHLFDWSTADLSAFDKPAPGTTQAVEWQLNCWDRIWEEDSNEDIPLMRLASAWLRNNMPVVDHVSVIHGDYRTGNFLYTEHDNKISAWLDWELAHLGDRHEDLAWVVNVMFGHLAEDGKTFLVGGLMSESDFCEAYEKASGLSINPKLLTYYRIKNAYQLATLTNATTYRISSSGKTHHDILVAWVMGCSYTVLDELRTQLEEVL